jgi:L-alanine-DL-glutamate epimerase-like enolase superfamily enzyme
VYRVATRFGGESVPVDRVEASAYRIPTDAPESDGTFAWNETGLVVAEVEAGGRRGLGFTYAHPAAAMVIESILSRVVLGGDALSPPALFEAMRREARNVGAPGLVDMGISAVDVALWDLKAKLLDLPLCTLLGPRRDRIEIYGSGGFTSYGAERLSGQFRTWAAEGLRQVKMKVGRDPAADLERVRMAREAVGEEVGLYVDANGAYSVKEALAFAEAFARLGVSWLEEPVSSEDLAGLHRIRERAPPGMEVTAGEYGHDVSYFHQMLVAGAVDVVQADATRCGGITGFLAAAAVAEAHGIPLSAHTAPAIHLHACLAAPGRLRPMEWFHDHVRIEGRLFDGSPAPRRGCLEADLSRPGLGLEFRRADAAPFAI